MSIIIIIIFNWMMRFQITKRIVVHIMVRPNNNLVQLEWTNSKFTTLLYNCSHC